MKGCLDKIINLNVKSPVNFFMNQKFKSLKRFTLVYTDQLRYSVFYSYDSNIDNSRHRELKATQRISEKFGYYGGPECIRRYSKSELRVSKNYDLQNQQRVMLFRTFTAIFARSFLFNLLHCFRRKLLSHGIWIFFFYRPCLFHK